MRRPGELPENDRPDPDPVRFKNDGPDDEDRGESALGLAKQLLYPGTNCLQVQTQPKCNRHVSTRATVTASGAQHMCCATRASVTQHNTTHVMLAEAVAPAESSNVSNVSNTSSPKLRIPKQSAAAAVAETTPIPATTPRKGHTSIPALPVSINLLNTSKRGSFGLCKSDERVGWPQTRHAADRVRRTSLGQQQVEHGKQDAVVGDECNSTRTVGSNLLQNTHHDAHHTISAGVQGV